MKNRVTKIMEKNGLTIAEFANKIDIPTGTLSAALKRNHTVNTPILQAILRTYPDINPEWLLMGKGLMMKGDKAYLEQTLFNDENEPETPTLQATPEYRKEKVVKEAPKPQKESDYQEVTGDKSYVKKIDKVMIFYTDKTFITLWPEE